MTTTLRRFGASVTTLLLASLPGAAQPAADRAPALEIVVSVAPLSTFVERVAGHRVAVQTLVRPGHNPHLYEPTPRQITALANADMFIRTGVPFEKAWIDRIRGVNPTMSILDVRQGMSPRQEPGHSDAHLDPHVWTSPPLAKQMAGHIRDALAALDPAYRESYDQGYAALAADLDALDRDIRTQLDTLKNRRFMVYHPAWGYLADTYGLTQIPVEHEGKEPGPKRIKELIDAARRDGTKLIIVQPQFTSKTAATIAQAIGGRIATADPLAIDYTANIRRVIRLIVEANAP